MRIIAIDDEDIALQGLVASIRKAAPDAQVEGFRKPKLALEYARTNPFDVAFLDIQMTGMTGMQLAEELIAINPSANLIFTTGYSQYAVEAFQLRASGYIIKPVTTAKVKQELDNLRFNDKPEEPKPVYSGLVIRAFGEFEVFYNGVPLAFKYRRSKELLAYLVDRKGAWCQNTQVMATLFKDPTGKESYYKQLRKDLADTLASIGQYQVLLRHRGEIGILASGVQCDYYDWMDGTADKSTFHGEYMSQYPWAQATRISLMSTVGVQD